ncbi:MAG: nucleotidyltransferase family protein [Clostridia bacterium]|nr:nucleotidyltransferase family protein [Clostridia bacterium]
MKVAGIIAEYNPFHNGHAHLVETARKNGATHVVAVMSGNFVQRGEPALFDRSVRTQAALMNGVDLVLQLPSVYAASAAQSFSRAAVEILDGMGIVDELVFGSECGDTEKLISAVCALESESLKPLLDAELKKGISFASARENALRCIDSDSADIIKSPNNILGVEYISALKKLGSRIVPVTFPRIGSDHDSKETGGNIASASNIRELFLAGGWERFVPENTVDIYKNAAIANIENIEKALLYKLRTADSESLSKAPDVSEGIENRIISAAETATNLKELYSFSKTKRYSHARIRRIILSYFLGFTAEDLAIPVPYIRVIGFNEKGAELIRNAGEAARLPIITKASDVASLGENAQKIFSLECRAGNIFALCFEKTLPCGGEKKSIPIIK